MTQIDEMLEKVPGAGRGNGGKYMSRLTPESAEVLELFQAWLVADDGKSEATSRQYKNYVAQALCHIEDGGDVAELSTDVRSALNALRRFRDATVPPASVEPTEEQDADEVLNES